MRPRKFYFVPMTTQHGKMKAEAEPFVRIGKNGQVNVSSGTLDQLGLNKILLYRLYQDLSNRTIGIHFTDKEKLDEVAAKEWKVWEPKTYKDVAKVAFGIKSFINNLTEVVLPTKRLPIGKYTDSETGIEYLWFRIPYGDETPGGKKFAQ